MAALRLVSTILITAVSAKYITYNETQNESLQLDDINENHKNDLKGEEPTENISKTCEVINMTTKDGSNFEVKHLNSIYLNNIYSVATSALIEDRMAFDKVEVNGINLYEVVTADCGGAQVCPNSGSRFHEKNTITIGFLSAYRWSQVRFKVFVL